MGITKTTELSKQLTQLRNGLSERSSPTDFVLAAIDQWATNDIFFREYCGKEFFQSLNNGTPTTLVIFKTPGTDHYFGLPESRTLLLGRLGFGTSVVNHYSPLLAAITMQQLDAEGFEYFGTITAPIHYTEGGVLPQAKYFDLSSGRLGKILKTTKYVGFRMTPEFGGEWLLVPKSALLPEGPSE